MPEKVLKYCFAESEPAFWNLALYGRYLIRTISNSTLAEDEGKRNLFLEDVVY